MTTTQTPTRPGPTAAELEASLEAYFYHEVRRGGGMIVKLAPTHRGVPDRMVLLPGGGIHLVELKATGGRGLSAIQRHWHEDAAALGTNVAVLTGRHEVNQWLRGMMVARDAALFGKPIGRPRGRSAQKTTEA